MSTRIIVGDCREVLRSLPDESAHCVVTSPPYWGLRDYGTARWEGGDPQCDHVETRKPAVLGSSSGLGFPADGGPRRIAGGNQYHEAYTAQFRGHCAKCGAVRIDSQLGLEASPDEYVANMVEVFREVRRVLRSDGTLWLNLGDCYATGAGRVGEAPGDGEQGARWRGDVERERDDLRRPRGRPEPGSNAHAGRGVPRRADGSAGPRVNVGPMTQPNRMPIAGLKPKDLVGIPWRLALALQEPYYTGRIRDERDRIWLAAMIDAEGCLFIHKRKAGQHNGQGYYRQNASFGPGLEVANTSTAIVERCLAITGLGSICSQGPEENGRRKQRIYRWNLRTIECVDVIREIYPHLVAKQHQARILCGCPPSGESAEAAHAALIDLHRGRPTNVDFSAPKSMFEQGWYLRQDIIWSKLNPMPESVRDRCTKAHEHLFLLSKSGRYFYDADAIAEPVTCEDPGPGVGGWATGADHSALGFAREGSPPSHGDLNKRASGSCTRGKHSAAPQQSAGHRIVESVARARADGAAHDNPFGATRNKRSVWTIATAPFSEAHFATFPPALIEPCILAGSPEGGVVLDPFFGAGTTGLVADRHHRDCIGVELNPEYAAMAERRIHGESPLFAQVTGEAHGR